jgi:hypothetical protein
VKKNQHTHPKKGQTCQQKIPAKKLTKTKAQTANALANKTPC